ncbi:hypothetical protein Taro_046264, partial [Colocasia esculenta]|nr:hypothetical protein [Colocasia esculenta]
IAHTQQTPERRKESFVLCYYLLSLPAQSRDAPSSDHLTLPASDTSLLSVCVCVCVHLSPSSLFPSFLSLLSLSLSAEKTRSLMGLRDIESTLPPGFRFYPSDEELVCHYLYKKVANERVSGGTMVEVDLHTREPWELPEVAKLSANEWYFFSFRDRKYATGSRTNRATKSGYWKATGKDRTVYEPMTHAVVGMRKTLVFYRGRAPNGIKSGWVMHEFRLENPHIPPKVLIHQIFAYIRWLIPKSNVDTTADSHLGVFFWALAKCSSVFHKRKGETVRYGLEAEQDNAGPSCSNLEPSSSSPLMDQMMTDGFEQQQQQLIAYYPTQPPHDHRDGAAASCQNGFLNLSVWHCDVVDFPPQMDSSAADGGDDLEEMRFRAGVDKVFF